MKNILKALFSLLFALSMATPAPALARTDQELDERSEERVTHSLDAGDYTLAFVKGDFKLSVDRAEVADQADALLVFITNPHGKLVRDAQVVTTIIGPGQAPVMDRARAYKGGYLINTAALTPGRYRLEAEIITDGWLLTDQFTFLHT